MQGPDTEAKITFLVDCGPLKAWSVIVTILGDLCQTPEDRLSGRSLTAIMGVMGIAPQTIRVALHRLRRDGWIVSDKQGRDAIYGLSDRAWTETQAVKDRIYSADPPPARPVRITIAPPGMTAADLLAVLPEDAVQVAPRTALVAGPEGGAPDIWATDADVSDPPDWVAEALAGDDLRADYERLTLAVQPLLTGPVPDTPVAAAACRLLVLHHWRRLRLRHGDLPDLVLGPDWEGALARRTVTAALAIHARPDLAELEG